MYISTETSENIVYRVYIIFRMALMHLFMQSSRYVADLTRGLRSQLEQKPKAKLIFTASILKSP